jgi:hypothetical protein
MDSLTDRLAALGDSDASSRASEQTVAADLKRCQAAMRHRRMRRTGLAGVAAVGVAAAATLGFIASANPAQHASPHPGRVQLVAYDGPQNPGFTVSTVPQGYVLQGAQPTTLDIARPGDKTSIDNFQNKLVVFLQSVGVKMDTHGTPVTVNGQPGYLRDNGDARVLEYTDGSHDVIVQAWSNIGLTDDQLVQFAEGVTVTSDAVQPRG